jgi:hypothetical protein
MMAHHVPMQYTDSIAVPQSCSICSTRYRKFQWLLPGRTLPYCRPETSRRCVGCAWMCVQCVEMRGRACELRAVKIFLSSHEPPMHLIRVRRGARWLRAFPDRAEFHSSRKMLRNPRTTFPFRTHSKTVGIAVTRLRPLPNSHAHPQPAWSCTETYCKNERFVMLKDSRWASVRS